MDTFTMFFLCFACASASLSNDALFICKMAEAIPALQTIGWKNCLTISNDDPCSGFSGISCISISTVKRIAVARIVLANGMGAIPSEIGLAGYLQEISISASGLTGTIPKEIANLPLLMMLTLKNMDLSGTIPTEIGLMNNLVSLQFSSLLHLSGTIPTEISKISRLYTLIVQGTSINGIIPTEIGLMKTLAEIRANDNLLSGGIPTEIGLLQRFSKLDLSNNRLSLELPRELGLMGNVTFQPAYITLKNNLITGTLPILTIGHYSFDVSGNRISGTLANTFSNTQSINLGNNKLTGTIPTELLTSRTFFLTLSSNSFSGALPLVIPQLSALYVDHNLLSGTIPSSYSRISVLDLSYNSLTGTFPDALIKTTTTSLNLAHNRLAGSIPSNLNKLNTLDLSSNAFTGAINIQVASSLRELYLDNNNLSGTIPTVLSTFIYLRKLSLSNIHLTGTIPTEFNYRLPSISYLDLSANELTGTLPVDLFKHSFDHFDISNNKMSGPIVQNSFSSLTMSYFNISSNEWLGCAPLNPILSNISICSFGSYFYSGCPIKPKGCQVTYLDNCGIGSSFYGETCIPCNCSSSLGCNDGTSGDGSCSVFNPCTSNKCEGNCIASGLNYTCSCTSPAVLNITDSRSCICPDSFYKSGSGSCYPCDPINNCFSKIKCSVSNSSKCSDCENGYYLENDLCKRCNAITNCFSSITCSTGGDSKCILCSPGYQLINQQCVVNENCLFDQWTEWSTCAICQGGIATRIRSLSSLNQALPIYCQTYLTNFTTCGFPCISEDITSPDGAIEYLYSSFTQWNWLNEQTSSNVSIVKDSNSISFQVCDNETVSLITSASLRILPAIHEDRWIKSISDCSLTMSVVQEKNPTITIVLAIVLPLAAIVLLILIYFIRRRHNSWIELLPKDLRMHFIHDSSWEKHGNVYMKKIDKSDNRFVNLWDSFSTKGIAVREVYSLCNPMLGANFANYRELLKQRMFDTPVLFNKRDWMLNSDDSNLRQYTHERYLELAKRCLWNHEEDTVPIVACIHGTDFEVGKSIASKGFSALASLDAGFYGKGIYFTTYANYAVPYFVNKPSPAILISLGTFGNAYPVVEKTASVNNMVGKPINSGYQSHFVLTREDGQPISSAHSNHEYNELVVAQEAQVVSIYLVKLEEDAFSRNIMKGLMKSRITTRKTTNLLNSIGDSYIEMSILEGR